MSSRDISATADDPPCDGFAQAAHYVAASSVRTSQTAPPVAMPAGASLGGKRFNPANEQRTAATKARMERCAELAAEGKTTKEIAAIMGLALNTVQKYAIDLGVCRRAVRLLTDEQRAQLQAMAAQGISAREASAQLGLRVEDAYRTSAALKFSWRRDTRKVANSAAFRVNAERAKKEWNASRPSKETLQRLAQLGPITDDEAARLVAQHVAAKGVTHCPPTKPASGDAWCFAGFNAPVRLAGDGKVRAR